MSFKKSEVVKVEKEIEMAVYEYLKENSDDLFLTEEISKVLRAKELISPEVKWAEGVITTRAVLDNLCRKKKAESHVCNGMLIFGAKEKK